MRRRRVRGVGGTAKLRMLRPMSDQVLAGKIGVVFGVANKRSIAWAIAKAWAAAGAKLIFNYQGERLKENVEELVGEFGEGTPLWPSMFRRTRKSQIFSGRCAVKRIDWI